MLQHDDVLDKVLNIINLVRGDDDRGAFVYVETEQGVPERAPHHSIHNQLDLIQEQDGKDVLVDNSIRYTDTLVLVDGTWLISRREQHVVITETRPL